MRPKFFHAGKVISAAGWHNQFPVHNYHELIVVFSGMMHVIDKDGKETVLCSGDSVIYPEGVYHKEFSDAAEPVESLYFAFEDPEIAEKDILVNRNCGTFLRSLAALFYEQFMTGEPMSYTDSFLRTMLEVFYSPSSEQKKESSLVRKADTYMRRYLSCAITLEDLAKVTGMSKYYFLRQYRQETGRTPIRALWDFRCKEAVSLLKYTELSIKEISLRTGFSDTGHFSRKIRQYTGEMPHEIRKKQFF